MISKFSCPSLLFLCGIVAPLRATDPPPAFRVECAIYRIHASVGGDTSLTEDIRLRDSTQPLRAVMGRLRFFTLADLKIGATAFHLDRNGASWNGQSAPPKGDEIILLSRPRVDVGDGQAAVMEIASEEANQYLTRRTDGLFELKTAPVKTGLKIELAPHQVNSNRVELNPFAVTISYVAGRKPVEGVELAIGEPQVSKDSESFGLGLNLDRFYGIEWLSEHQGMLLLILQVRRSDGLVPASSTATAEPAPSPTVELAITGQDIFTFKEAQGQRYLAVTIHNRGGGTAALAEARFFLGNPEQGGKLLGQGGLRLEEGRSGTEAIPWDAAPGRYEVFVVLDPDRRLNERSRAHHLASATIVVE